MAVGAISSTPARRIWIYTRRPRLSLSLSAAGGGHSGGAQGRGASSDLACRTGTRRARGGAVLRWIGAATQGS